MAGGAPQSDRAPRDDHPANRPHTSIDFRRAARILAMQAVCQFDALGETFRASLPGFLGDEPQLPGEPSATLDPRDREKVALLARELALRAWDQRARWDARLAAVSTNWNPARMMGVDRAVLRVAIGEMLEGGTPPQVAINEAIEIARAYGTKDSAAFVNGVLDAVRRAMPNDSAPS